VILESQVTCTKSSLPILWCRSTVNFTQLALDNYYVWHMSDSMRI